MTSHATLLGRREIKAAERLGVAAMVRAVERVAIEAVASGDVRLEDLAFAGCPHVAALCENYLAIPGVRAPPPFKISTHLPELAAAHGALLVVGTTRLKYSSPDPFWVVAGIDACHVRASSSSCDCPKDVFAKVIERTVGRKHGLCLFAIDSLEDLAEFDAVHPKKNATWISKHFLPSSDIPGRAREGAGHGIVGGSRPVQ